ncbi:MAG: hypothetical protein KatS3mg131_1390 [Candidatus Tectimicrobiota bacterium]|nr:MAG: hypothetical protein KatS3mg131_1390 [Candidatus Tectomicrobia bacterium]
MSLPDLYFCMRNIFSAKKRKHAMAKDPVCGMEVEEATAAATAVYEGKTYYFCAVGCKQAFEQAPQKYLAQSEEAAGQ